MTEISSHFILIAPERIRQDLRLRRVTYIPVDADEFACTQKISVQQSCLRDDRGDVWTVSFRAVTADCSVRRHDGTRRYVGIIMSDGSVRIIGSPGEAPILSVTPSDQGMSVVETSFDSPDPLDL